MGNCVSMNKSIIEKTEYTSKEYEEKRNNDNIKINRNSDNKFYKKTINIIVD